MCTLNNKCNKSDIYAVTDIDTAYNNGFKEGVMDTVKGIVLTVLVVSLIYVALILF